MMCGIVCQMIQEAGCKIDIEDTYYSERKFVKASKKKLNILTEMFTEQHDLVHEYESYVILQYSCDKYR